MTTPALATIEPPYLGSQPSTVKKTLVIDKEMLLGATVSWVFISLISVGVEFAFSK